MHFLPTCFVSQVHLLQLGCQVNSKIRRRPSSNELEQAASMAPSSRTLPLLSRSRIPKVGEPDVDEEALIELFNGKSFAAQRRASLPPGAKAGMLPPGAKAAVSLQRASVPAPLLRARSSKKALSLAPPDEPDERAVALKLEEEANEMAAVASTFSDVHAMLVEVCGAGCEETPAWSSKRVSVLERELDDARRAIEASRADAAKYQEAEGLAAERQGMLEVVSALDMADMERGKQDTARLFTNVTNELERLRKRRGQFHMIESNKLRLMLEYLEFDLPAIQKASREKIEAKLELGVSLSTTELSPSLQNAIVEDVALYVGVATERLRPSEVTDAPPLPEADASNSCKLVVHVLEGKGRTVDGILLEVERAHASGRLNAQLSVARKLLPRPSPRAPRAGEEPPKRHELKLLSCSSAGSQLIVHDPTTILQRLQELQMSRAGLRTAVAKAEERMDAMYRVQVALWKAEGGVQVMQQCANQSLLKTKAEEEARWSELIEGLAMHQDSQQELERARLASCTTEAQIEALTMLRASADEEVLNELTEQEREGHVLRDGLGDTRAESDATSPSHAKATEGTLLSKTSLQWKSYSRETFSDACIKHVRAEVLKLRAAIPCVAMVEEIRESEMQLDRQRWHAQGGSFLLDKAIAIHQEDIGQLRLWATPQVALPGTAPSNLLAFHRCHLKREKNMQYLLRSLAAKAVEMQQVAAKGKYSKGSATHWQRLKAVMQFSAREPLSSNLSEVHVEWAAAELEVGLTTATRNEFRLVWLIVAYIFAPLPFGFAEVGPDDEGDGARGLEQSRKGGVSVSSEPFQPPRFLNKETGEVSSEHPFRDVFRQLIREETRRETAVAAFKSASMASAKSQNITLAPEAWMEFAADDGMPYYYCFANREKTFQPPQLSPSTVLGLPLGLSAAEYSERVKACFSKLNRGKRLTKESVHAMQVVYSTQPCLETPREIAHATSGERVLQFKHRMRLHFCPSMVPPLPFKSRRRSSWWMNTPLVAAVLPHSPAALGPWASSSRWRS